MFMEINNTEDNSRMPSNEGHGFLKCLLYDLSFSIFLNISADCVRA